MYSNATLNFFLEGILNQYQKLLKFTLPCWKGILFIFNQILIENFNYFLNSVYSQFKILNSLLKFSVTMIMITSRSNEYFFCNSWQIIIETVF